MIRWDKNSYWKPILLKKKNREMNKEKLVYDRMCHHLYIKNEMERSNILKKNNNKMESRSEKRICD